MCTYLPQLLPYIFHVLIFPTFKVSSLPHRCSGCITIGMNKCRWCLFSHECIPDRAPYLCSDQDSALNMTIGHNEQCPLILPSADDGYRIHVNYVYPTPPLLVSTSDLSVFQAQFDANLFRYALTTVGNTAIYRAQLLVPTNL